MKFDSFQETKDQINPELLTPNCKKKDLKTLVLSSRILVRNKTQ